MAKVGRKPFVVDDDVLRRVEAHAATGLTNAQICTALGISKSVYFKNKAVNKDLMDAYNKGRARGIGTIANALFQTAKGGNVTAQIFYLKNTTPDTFKDRVPEGTVMDSTPPQSFKIEMVDGRKQTDKTDTPPG